MIYLDNAATTWPKHRKLFDRMVELYMELGVSPGRGSYDQATLAENHISDARKKLAAFFGAPDPDRVIFTSNATDALNQALFGIMKPGSRVVTSRLEHNSVLRPLYHLQQTRKVSTTLVSFNNQGYIEPSEIERVISLKSVNGSAKVDLVAINHASNVLGTLQPVAEIGKICEAHGIPMLVDASQSAGQVSVDMTELKASALVITGHKSLYGPPGIGALILHPDLQIQTSRFGGTGIESKSMIHSQAFPQRLEAGTHNLMGIIGISLAIETLEGKGLAAIHDREMELTRKLYRGLERIPGTTLYGGTSLGLSTNENSQKLITQQEEHPQLALFSANLTGMHPNDLAAILDGDFNIAVRSGLHCAPLVHETMGTGEQGAIRFSVGQYNSDADIDQTIKAMNQIAQLHTTS